MCSCRGPSACKQGRRIYNTLLLQAMALYIHGPLRCKNLLGRIPNPHSCHALAAPQPTHPAEGHHAQISSTTPRRSTGNRTPSTTRTPTIRPPGGIPDTHSTHPHSPDQTPSRPRWKLCSTRSPTRSGPQTARKPARLSSRTGFFFCMMEPDTARQKRLGRTTQPDRRPHCPLHPYSAGEIIHRAVRERTTTSTTTALRPTRAGPHWKPTADPAGSSNHHAHDQTAYVPAARPVHAAPVLVMGKPPRGHCPTHSKPHPDRPQISQPEPPRPRRRASEARHSVRHTARHFFKSKAQIRHIPAVSHPL